MGPVISLLLSSLLLSAPCWADPYASAWPSTPESNNIVDLRTNAQSSAYRKAVVNLSESISGLMRASGITESDKATCRVVAESGQVIWQIGEPIQSKEPTQLLPSEQELAADPGLAATVAKADADTGALKAISAALEVKKAKISDAAALLRATYGASHDQAKRLTLAIVKSDFTGCRSKFNLGNDGAGSPLNAKSDPRKNTTPTPSAPGTDPGSQYQRYLTERTQSFVDAYDGVNGILQSLLQDLNLQQSKVNTILLRGAMLGKP